MAGAAQGVPKQLNDSGPNAVNPGITRGCVREDRMNLLIERNQLR
jgi:hypothetical protein